MEKGGLLKRSTRGTSWLRREDNVARIPQHARRCTLTSWDRRFTRFLATRRSLHLPPMNCQRRVSLIPASHHLLQAQTCVV